MPPTASPFRRADLARRDRLAFRVEPDAAARAALADELGISGIRKLLFEGQIDPEGRADWRLTGKLGATVVQPCVVTLAPVVTRIDLPVTRRYVADWSEPAAGSEIEMPEDTDTEPLGSEIDAGAVMAEELALALPDYPRADGAALETGEAGDSAAPERENPFKVLKSLLDKDESGN